MRRVPESARSSRSIARARRRLWGGASSEDEFRENLHSRLDLFTKLMFWSFVCLLLFLGALYELVLEPVGLKPKSSPYVFGGAAVLLATMALIWRAMLRTRPSVEVLYAIDLAYGIGVGCGFGASAAIQWDLSASGYTSLIFTGYAVFTRALLVPCSARRTAIVASLTMLPLAIAAVYIGIAHPPFDLPPIGFIAGALLIVSTAVVIAATGSGIIYGLRQQVSEAMQLGQYKLDRKIGEGGIGTVYRAHHALLRRPTAVKLLQPDRVGPENLERFEKEVQLMSQLTHPNTVAVFDYGHNPDGVFYYAMEYLGGLDLEQLVKRFGPLPAGRVVHILVQVCGALQEAHDAGLIHRDIKPANIILCERGGLPDVAKVVDFGLVKEITNDTGASTQVILGTPAYIAPEAVSDPGRIGPGVDLYALGAVGYYLVTGRRVFEAKTAIDMCIQHATQAPRRPSEVTTNYVPAELESILLRCLAKAPSERFPSASALAEALDALPKTADWNVVHARTWWTDFRARAEVPPPSTTAETMTITVDLGDRA